MRGVPSGGHFRGTSFPDATKLAGVIIPEAAVLERIGRGVLDRPVKPGDDSVKTSMLAPHSSMTDLCLLQDCGRREERSPARRSYAPPRRSSNRHMRVTGCG